MRGKNKSMKMQSQKKGALRKKINSPWKSKTKDLLEFEESINQYFESSSSISGFSSKMLVSQ